MFEQNRTVENNLQLTVYFGKRETKLCKSAWEQEKRKRLLDVYCRFLLTSAMMAHLHVTEQMREAQAKFEKACHQIVLLDQKIRDLEVRYKRAVKNKKHSFRYNLRLRLSVVTGVKMMYHHYASTKAEELDQLRRQMVGRREVDEQRGVS